MTMGYVLKLERLLDNIEKNGSARVVGHRDAPALRMALDDAAVGRSVRAAVETSLTATQLGLAVKRLFDRE